MRWRSFIAAALCAALAWPATAAMRVPTTGIGSNSGSSVSSIVITVANGGCRPGSTIIVLANYGTVASTVSSVSDSQSNTYTVFDNITGTNVGIGWASAPVTTALQNSDTITVHYGGTTNGNAVGACLVGIGALDTHNHSASGTSATTATTVNTGTLAFGYEVILGGLVTATASAAQSCNAPTGLISGSSSVNGSFILCGVAVVGTGSQSFAPSWTNSRNYVSDVISFKPRATSLLGAIGAGP
jgi:hypothetical protein